MSVKPRRRRKSNEEKALEILRKAAEEQGKTLDMSAFGLTTDAAINRERQGQAHRELDAVAAYLRKSKTFYTKTCYNCGETFKTDFPNVGCCSVDCYVPWFERTTGLKPNLAERPMWRYGRPLIISPESLKQLVQWAKAVLEDNPGLSEQEEEPSSTSSDSSLPSQPEFLGVALPELSDDFLTSH